MPAGLIPERAQKLQDRRRQRQVGLMASLTGYADPATSEIDVAPAQVHRLAQAEADRKHELQRGRIVSPQHGEERIALVGLEHTHLLSRLLHLEFLPLQSGRDASAPLVTRAEEHSANR